MHASKMAEGAVLLSNGGWGQRFFGDPPPSQCMLPYVMR